MTITGQSVSKANVFTSKDNYPVFRGLEDLRISGKEIAGILGVSPSTYSKWRSGKLPFPPVKLVLLTLLLANWIEEAQAELDMRTRISRDLQSEAAMKALRRCLILQEEANRSLTQDQVREGSRLFRKWWQAKVAINPKMANRQAVA